MKFFYRLLFLPIFILAFTGCSDDREFVDYSKDDSSLDGKVTQLQKHTIGNGVPIILVCSGFSDGDIQRGKYRAATNWALEGLFSVHPMKSLRDYFDVYEVAAVSYSSDNPLSDSIISEKFDILRYEDKAMKVIGEDRSDDVTAILLHYTTHWFRQNAGESISSDSESDIPTGSATANVIIPLEENRAIKRDGDPRVLLHEAIGHGFAKLADEYVEDRRKWDEDGYDSYKEYLTEHQKYGYDRNISFDSDVTKTPWADFAADSRYDFEKLGCYEGGYYQEKGVYRATENSIMRNHYLSDGSCFNVAGRVMIYKRCMKIAYGDSWKFNYEDFVKFDLEKAKAEHEDIKKQYPKYSKSKRFGAPPRFVKMKASR